MKKHIPLILAMVAFVLAIVHLYSSGPHDTWYLLVEFLYVGLVGGAGVMMIFGGDE